MQGLELQHEAMYSNVHKINPSCSYTGLKTKVLFNLRNISISINNLGKALRWNLKMGKEI